MTRVILNGFFRSGTTALWRAVSQANPGRHILYEPCHPQLIARVQGARADSRDDPLHGVRLWDSYVPRLPELQRIRQTYPLPAEVFPRAPGAVARYAGALFDQLGADLLQVNRWHYVLADTARATGATPVHILRHPAKLFRSFTRIFRDRRGPSLGRLLGWIAPDFLPPNSWQMRTALREGPDATPGLRALGRTPRHLSTRGFDVFMAVWTQANCAAVADCRAAGGAVFWIEDIVQDPGPFAALMADFGLDMDVATLSPARVGDGPGASDWSQWADRMRRYGLDEPLLRLRRLS